MFKGSGFLGTGASFGADLTLIVQTIFYIGLCIGIWAQRNKKYKLHDRIQTPIVVLNLFFIIAIMAGSFREQAVVANVLETPGESYFLIAALHGILGTLAEGLAIYCLLAGHKILPRKIGKLRYWMWATFVLWTLSFLFGWGTYYNWYLKPAAAEQPAAPVLVNDNGESPNDSEKLGNQRFVLQQFSFKPGDVTVLEGTTIEWLNQDSAPHNVALGDGSYTSPNFFQGKTESITFDSPGAYEVYCTLHGVPTSGMASKVIVLTATDENINVVEEEAVAVNNAVAANLIPPDPTPAAKLPPAPVTLIEPPTPQIEVAGIASFQDLLGSSDSILISLSDVAPASEGMEIHLWLTNDKGEVLDLGRATPDGDGRLEFTYVDPERQNLMARFNGVQLTLEPVGDADSAPGEVLYSGRQAAAAYTQIQAITVGDGVDNPFGYGTDGRIQVEELIRHIEYVQIAYDLGSIADARRHSEHILNILTGITTDYDGVHGAQNPGDGVGIIPYLQKMQDAAAAAASESDATNAIKTHATHVQLATNNSLRAAADIELSATTIVNEDQIGDISTALATLHAAADQLLNGFDADGNGKLAIGEGGIFVAYQHAQYMGAIGLMAGDSAEVVDPEPIVDLPLEEQIEAGAVTLDMLDFKYSEALLTVPAGVEIDVSNLGRARHSITGDDGSWDSGLLKNGEATTLSFDEPGTYDYYCALHGSAGGNGMSGTIIVTDK